MNTSSNMGSNTSFNQYPAEARVGREDQVYDQSGIRQVVGTIAVDPSTNKVLVVSSSKRENVWVLPKGGWENDETKEESAERETYEEGGVRGQIHGLVGSFLHVNAYGEIKSKVWFYEFEVEEILQDWPERSFRLRKWCTFEEAMTLLRFKPFMQKALMKSSFSPKGSLPLE